jgi:archaellum biogenesis protein FlaJ (TadC family)
MRSTYLMLMVLLPAIAAVNALYFGAELRRFAMEVPRLESSHHLERFKQVVARQMYAALVQIVLLALPAVVFVVGIARGALTTGDILFVVIPAAVIILIAQVNRRDEARVRELPAEPTLTAQRDRIVRTWVRKPLPDW